MLTDIDVLLMVEKRIRGGISHYIKTYAKANNKYTKDYDQFNEWPYIKYWDVNKLYGWVMSKKLPVNDFKWTEDISELEESFIKSYNEESDRDYFCEFHIQNP